MKIANLNIQKLGNFEDYTNKNKYSIKQFKSDFKDYQLNQSLNKEKRDLIDNAKSLLSYNASE